jgi:hypothetical protein
MTLCCHCEKRPGICGAIPLPLCLVCRTKNYELVAAAETKQEPITLSLMPPAAASLAVAGSTISAR